MSAEVLEVLRVSIEAWTASFRYPIFVSGFQPTLPVPPLSTVYGLLSSALGKYVTPSDLAVGYVFTSTGKGVDIETIYELGSSLKNNKPNICRREILFEPCLTLYLPQASPELEQAFRTPYYPLLIGRSTELAAVTSCERVILRAQEAGKLGGTVIPFPTNGVYGILQALPTHFSDGIPRQALGTRPFYILKDFIQYQGTALYQDTEKDWLVYFFGNTPLIL